MQTSCAFLALVGRLARATICCLGALACQVPLQAQADLAFPQIIVGDQFETVVQIANQTAVSDEVAVEAFSGGEGSNGTPLKVEVNGAAASAEHRAALAPFQETTLRLGLRGAGLTSGWLRVRSSAPGGKIAASLFYRITGGGQVLDSVGVTDSRRYRFAQLQFDDRDDGTQTGIALVNPDDSVVECRIDLFQGAALKERFTVTLEPRQHFARLLSEVFPGFPRLAGSLVVEASAGRAIPILTLRLDGSQLTSLPVRPLGFTLQYELRNAAGELQESGYWVLDSEGLNLVGLGWKQGEDTAEGVPVLGTWVGRSFQALQRRAFADGTVGAIVFVGASAGEETTAGEPIDGTATVIGPEGVVISAFDFLAFPKY